MCKVLMSINPEHVDNIITGLKTYEFRKNKCKREISSIIVYSTAPVKKIVCEVEVTDIIEGLPETVWKKTHNGAGIDKKFYDDYFMGKKKAFAYCLGKVNLYVHAKKLEDFGIKIAPQSFVYIETE